MTFPPTPPKVDIAEIAARRCGPCYACCVHLGIRALQKLGGQPCKHLDGRRPADQRCGIYDERPEACVDYLCGWRRGLGDETMRPNESGILATIYPDDDDPTRAQATLHVIDPKKAGKFDDPTSLLHSMIQDLLTRDLAVSTSGRVANVTTVIVVLDGLRAGKPMLYFRDGEIHYGKILPSKGYEDFNFIAEDKRVGSYAIKHEEQP